jgi:hypothetical protein
MAREAVNMWKGRTRLSAAQALGRWEVKGGSLSILVLQLASHMTQESCSISLKLFPSSIIYENNEGGYLIDLL